MRIFSFPLIIIIICFVQSCATPDKAKVKVVGTQQAQISKVLTDEASSKYLKRRVAIARFTNETKYGRSFFSDGKDENVGKQATDILSAKLAATNKFLLLERSDIEKTFSEMKLKIARDELSELHLSADYLIIGSISELGRREVGEVSVFSRSKKQTAYCKVNVRLIDVHTGEIVYSEEGSGEAFSEVGSVMGLGGRAGYDYTLNDKVISAAISKLVNNIIENLLDKPWRSYILSYDGSFYFTAGGKSQGIAKGDIFEVFRRGNKVKNPQTGLMIELPGQLIGKIKVENMMGNTSADEISMCSRVSGNLPNERLDQLYVQEVGRK
jgi:curli biogenesis system outer membrane secretion channel CsgG